MHLHGSITALATPFDANGAIDLPAYETLIAAQLQAGSAGIVVAGSTGEATALSEDEYDALLSAAVKQASGRMRVLAGTGQSNTSKTVALTRRAAALGADAALVVTPPYVRPTQAGLLAHYRAVADEGGLPVVLYNVPPRSGVDLLPETVAELASHPGIVAFKEAVSDIQRIRALVEIRPQGFSLLSGDDPSFVQAMGEGFDGVISVASNVVPAAFARICAQMAAGERDSAAALDAELAGLYRFLGIEPNPTPVKALLQRLGLGQGLRLPLLTLSTAHGELADATASQVRALESSILAASRSQA
ncbi:4-hydroxy-tetrahydrodipicolinate synthase [Alkalisalibacterium limincola]|uniref:4-hydroxy-tetrahydrodipicolinate synthase n=1 Tax=Alkalisalibacterium limincola TaxID=2699169 RepID=A0A5C8KPJ6_9GAMM|nr:4-hydroxy-tetrahydrodipicolinate synthase [Alkalisalibacterium limincola]TXK62072.1 4-hydroxy-tetrahydrodipicolinate synthase [Alkalisalibacterium limincola]